MFLFFYRSKVIVHVQNSKFKTFTFSLYTFYYKEINNHKNLKPLIYVQFTFYQQHVYVQLLSYYLDYTHMYNYNNELKASTQ
jgi:hypothetical protein